VHKGWLTNLPTFLGHLLLEFSLVVFVTETFHLVDGSQSLLIVFFFFFDGRSDRPLAVLSEGVHGYTAFAAWQWLERND